MIISLNNYSVALIYCLTYARPLIVSSVGLLSASLNPFILFSNNPMASLPLLVPSSFIPPINHPRRSSSCPLKARAQAFYLGSSRSLTRNLCRNVDELKIPEKANVRYSSSSSSSCSKSFFHFKNDIFPNPTCRQVGKALFLCYSSSGL